MPVELASTVNGNNRPVQTAEVFSPTVLSLQGEYLVCHTDRLPRPSGSGILDGFLNLADAEPDEILNYARKWGALGTKSNPKRIPGLRYLESLAKWRAAAKQFRALHRIGAELNSQRI